MKAVLVEDEISACENFMYLLQQIDASIEIVKVLDGVKSAIDYFKNNKEPDLIFMDVHLGDGIAFEIFEAVTISAPIIFTTAYDQYAIKAFKLNSIDYLLKPINEDELGYAISKFKENNVNANDIKQIQKVLTEIKQQYKKYKATFLVHQKDALIPVKTIDFAFFYIELSLVKGITRTNETFILDRKMEDLEEELDPSLFYRINRQFIAQRTAIGKINYSFNGKLTITVSPKFNESIVISKAKSMHFKEWMSKY